MSQKTISFLHSLATTRASSTVREQDDRTDDTTIPVQNGAPKSNEEESHENKVISTNNSKTFLNASSSRTTRTMSSENDQRLPDDEDPTAPVNVSKAQKNKNHKQDAKKQHKQQQQTWSRFRVLLCGCFCGTLWVLVGVLLWYFFVFSRPHEDNVASCGDCYCIAGNQTCPIRTKPRMNFTKQEIRTWASLEVINPYQLDCDPYVDNNCQTNPPQNQTLMDLGDVAVCAIHFEHANVDPDHCEYSRYWLKTYASMEEALEAGGFVTHAGHCGVCSTLQDFAAYLDVMDLTTQGKICTAQGAVSPESGRNCYRDLGLTDACAEMWWHNSWNTAKNCFRECVIGEGTKDSPNNGPAPECKMNDCLECDEEKSGYKFRRIAGRTRRRSGVLSSIARPCDQINRIPQYPCPATRPLADTD